MKIQVINKSKHALPEYATGQSAGWISVLILTNRLCWNPCNVVWFLRDFISHCLKVLKRKSVHVAGWLLRKASSPEFSGHN